MTRPLEKEGRSRSHVTVLHAEPDLVPGLRERLVSELDHSAVAVNSRVRYLSAETGRAAQSVMRWLSQKSPGLPDLRSLAILCLRLEVDANWMLGLIRARRPFPKEAARISLRTWLPHAPSPDWTGRLDFTMEHLAHGYEVYLMKGDDMTPVISDGMPFLVDASVKRISGNGIYFLTLAGMSLVRYVEMTPDRKCHLRCANHRYGDITVDLGISTVPAMEVLGKVCMAFEVKHF